VEDIEAGLEPLTEEIRARSIRSIAIPPLGSGLGGLSWDEVRQRIEEALRGLDDVRIVIYEPSGAPDEGRMTRRQEAPNMTPGRAALVGLIHRYVSGLLDSFVTLLEVHKLMYFMQVAGEPLRLQYRKAPYAGEPPPCSARGRGILRFGLCGRWGPSQQAARACARRNEGCGRRSGRPS
jgi:hypothetical protein